MFGIMIDTGPKFYSVPFPTPCMTLRWGLKARMSSNSGLWFQLPIYIFKMRFDLGTLDSGERSLPFGLLVHFSFSLIFKH